MSAGKSKGCIFCDAPKSNQDDEAMIFARRASVFGMMNRFPYNTGHVLIAPYRHVRAVEDLSAGEWEEMRCLMSNCIAAIRESMAPDGFNVGFNVGKTAGAGFSTSICTSFQDGTGTPTSCRSLQIPRSCPSTSRRLLRR
ncbi:MAG TPA: HIT domain-containing protein [Candidatus Methanomethylicus sp.]|nr:HIT domain-containing protein [Candidatus Methanomethylicus sp.]